MKRFLTLSIVLTVLFLTSCDSPLSNMGGKMQQSLVANKAATTITPGMPQAKADSIRKNIWQQFINKNGSQWRIRWSKKTGLPVSMYFGTTKQAYRGAPKQAASAFLADHVALLGFGSLKNLRYLRTATMRGIRFVRFNQTVKGVPVYEAQYVVQLNERGHVIMVNGHYYPNIQVSTTPSVSSSQAVQTAKSALKGNLPQKIQSNAKLVIYRYHKKFHLAWKLGLSSEKPVMYMMFMIDAHSGNILVMQNGLVDAVSTAGNRAIDYKHSFNHYYSLKTRLTATVVTGDGNVFPTYPPNSSPTDEPLYRLNGSGYLTGTYVKVVNDVAPRANLASESFYYNKTNIHFDEVNLYYHIDLFRHHFVNQYTSDIGFKPIIAHAYALILVGCGIYGCVYTEDNAAFNRSDQELYFGDGTSNHPPDNTHPPDNDFAKSDKLIYHEYGHAVIYSINQNIGDVGSRFTEEGAISEGVPDYWAGAFTNRSKILNWAAPSAEWDMENPTIKNYSQYESYKNSHNGHVPSHLGGEFFSSILWDIHNSIGAQRTNALTFAAILGLLSDPTFLGFRTTMIVADITWYGGEDVPEIKTAFANKGIGEPPHLLSVTITGPLFLVQPGLYQWTANPSNGTSPYQYQWGKRYYYRNGNITNWFDASNTQSVYQVYNTFMSRIYLRVTVIDANNNTTTSGSLIVRFVAPNNSMNSQADATILKGKRKLDEHR